MSFASLCPHTLAKKKSMECIIALQELLESVTQPRARVVFLLVEYLSSSETLHVGEQVIELVKKLQKLVT